MFIDIFASYLLVIAVPIRFHENIIVSLIAGFLYYNILYTHFPKRFQKNFLVVNKSICVCMYRYMFFGSIYFVHTTKLPTHTQTLI